MLSDETESAETSIVACQMLVNIF